MAQGFQPTRRPQGPRDKGRKKETIHYYYYYYLLIKININLILISKCVCMCVPMVSCRHYRGDPGRVNQLKALCRKDFSR